jgi:hypothetical protein
MCSPGYPAWNAHAPCCIVACGLPGLYNIIPHFFITARFSKKKVIEHKSVFLFSLHLFPEIILILRIIQQYLIKIYTCLHGGYRLFLSYFNGKWIFWTDLRKILKYKILWKFVQWEPSCSMPTKGQTDRLTDWHEVANSRFSRFCEGAPKQDVISWFQTFAVFWRLYVFSWVILRRLCFVCRCFGTLCLFHLHMRICVPICLWRWKMA